MKKSALATVFLVVVIDLMGFGIVLPLLPFYAQEFQASAVTIGLLYSVYSFMQLIFSPIWGSLVRPHWPKADHVTEHIWCSYRLYHFRTG
jgi:MFS family permease